VRTVKKDIAKLGEEDEKEEEEEESHSQEEEEGYELVKAITPAKRRRGAQPGRKKGTFIFFYSNFISFTTKYVMLIHNNT
jgi:hypothetical protein